MRILHIDGREVRAVLVRYVRVIGGLRVLLRWTDPESGDPVERWFDLRENLHDANAADSNSLQPSEGES